ncbi:hypothetical protein Tco_0693412 [Tanacetum coccineum]
MGGRNCVIDVWDITNPGTRSMGGKRSGENSDNCDKERGDLKGHGQEEVLKDYELEDTGKTKGEICFPFLVDKALTWWNGPKSGEGSRLFAAIELSWNDFRRGWLGSSYVDTESSRIKRVVKRSVKRGKANNEGAKSWRVLRKVKMKAKVGQDSCMDWLSRNKAVIVCHEKRVEIPLEGGEALRVHEERALGLDKTLSER